MKRLDVLHIGAVRGDTKGDWYSEYRRLRYRIFVVEQGWTGLTGKSEPGTTVEDPADERARFWLARSSAGELVGILRERAVSDAFPHRELFARHLRRPEVVAMLPWIGTLNSLAVDRRYRGRLCRGADGQVGTAARLLLRTCLAESAEAGLLALVATAQSVISTKALVGVGFRVIDLPVRTPLHATFLMCNVGIVLGGSAETESRRKSLSRYFWERAQEVLGSATIEELFSNATSPRASEQ